jgi:hypothetical protein
VTFDYDTVLESLTNKLRQKASWAEILFYSTNNRIIEVIAEGIAQLGAYDEWLTRNTKWDLATEKSALVAQAQFMQYDPHRKIGATGTIRVSTDENFAGKYGKIVEFPKYTTFGNEAGTIKFVSTSAENLLTTENYIDIPVVQGELKTFSYIAQGDNYEEISITNSNIENDEYELYVNGTLWTEIDDLNEASEDQKVYKLENKLNYDGINIIFGNGIFGRKLTSGDNILFKYVETQGIEGNITSTNIITVVEDTIYDIDNDQVDIYCKNTANLDGGNDEEDIEDIRSNGTDTFQAGEKAITKKDYEVKLEAFDYILKSVVWGAYEYNLDNNNDLWDWIETQENVVNVSAFTPAGEQLTTSQQTDVIETLNEDKPPTDIIRFTEVEFIKLIFHIDAYVIDESYILSEVKTDIIDGVTDRYSLQNIDFFEPIYETEWKGYVNDISGVCHHSSYIEIAKLDTFNVAYQADFLLDLYVIEPETVKVYVKGGDVGDEYILIGTDDGNGNFTSESPYDLTGSSIDYNTGEGTLIVVSGLSSTYTEYDIKLIYQRTNLNICPNKRNQILTVYDITDVTAQYTEEGSCD